MWSTNKYLITKTLPVQCIYYIKLKSRPSVRPSVRIFLVEWIFAVDARIHVKLARNEAPVFWEHEVCFYNVLTPAVRHLRRFECQGVDDSCRNFTYIPANRSPDTIDNIYYICFQYSWLSSVLCVVTHPTRDWQTQVWILCISIFFFSSTFL